jgi:polysaccharide export outer membrane protein
VTGPELELRPDLKADDVNGVRFMRWGWAAVLSLLLLAAGSVPHAKAQSNLPGPTAERSMGIPPAEASPTAPPAMAPIEGPQDENYKLGSGDKIKLTVYGEDDLSGEYLVDGAGQIQLPLLGQVPAAGMTLHAFVSSVTNLFVSEGYLKHPRVSVEVENYRPFYIIGEVKTPGQYPYISGMNALNAIALAGGYTYRADDTVVYVRHNGSSNEVKDPADQTTKIGPGDIIRVGERVF